MGDKYRYNKGSQSGLVARKLFLNNKPHTSLSCTRDICQRACYIISDVIINDMMTAAFGKMNTQNENEGKSISDQWNFL